MRVWNYAQTEAERLRREIKRAEKEAEKRAHIERVYESTRELLFPGEPGYDFPRCASCGWPEPSKAQVWPHALSRETVTVNECCERTVETIMDSELRAQTDEAMREAFSDEPPLPTDEELDRDGEYMRPEYHDE
jgi:hypothetical protein